MVATARLGELDGEIVVISRRCCWVRKWWSGRVKLGGGDERVTGEVFGADSLLYGRVDLYGDFV